MVCGQIASSSTKPITPCNLNMTRYRGASHSFMFLGSSRYMVVAQTHWPPRIDQNWTLLWVHLSSILPIQTKIPWFRICSSDHHQCSFRQSSQYEIYLFSIPKPEQSYQSLGVLPSPMTFPLRCLQGVRLDVSFEQRKPPKFDEHDLLGQALGWWAGDVSDLGLGMFRVPAPRSAFSRTSIQNLTWLAGWIFPTFRWEDRWTTVSNNLIYCQPSTIFWNQYFSDWLKPLITFFGM